MGDNDTFTLLLGGIIGYITGKGNSAHFESFINRYLQRLEQLKFFKIYPRMEFFNKNPNTTIVFRESILCYLFGLPNSCLPNIVRVLENALHQKYKIVTQSEPSKMDLFALINWAETSLGISVPTAHSYRMLRNLIHTDKLVYEQDCLEGIRHVTNIITDIFPGFGEFQISCPYCHLPKNENIEFIDTVKFLGNTLEIPCKCGRKYNWTVFP